MRLIRTVLLVVTGGAVGAGLTFLLLIAIGELGRGPADRPQSHGRESSQETMLSGIIHSDASEGCGGEEPAVKVRDGVSIVGSGLAETDVRGFDCSMTFEVSISNSQADCYELYLDGNPVGNYPGEALRSMDFHVGIIEASAIYSRPYQDWPYGC